MKPLRLLQTLIPVVAATCYAQDQTTDNDITLITLTSPTNALTISNQCIIWNEPEGSTPMQNFALSFKLTLTNTSVANDPLMSTERTDGDSKQGNILSLATVTSQDSTKTVTLAYETSTSNQQQFTQTTTTDNTLLLTLIVKRTSDSGDNNLSVSLYSGATSLGTKQFTATDASDLTSNSSTFWSNGGKDQFADFQLAQITATTNDTAILQAFNIITVPEPATAALSLLALGGLLTRRQRNRA